MSLFISFEGIDGCGKTTQLQLLRSHLEKMGYPVVTTREPGGTALAEAIRNYLLHSSQALEARAELLLFSAARAQHVAELIRPALNLGKVVLCDRFADSTVAYQGGGLGLEIDFITRLNSFATDSLQPDITFLLDVAPQMGWQRRSGMDEEDRIESRGLDFQERVRAAFLDLASSEPTRVVVIDGALPVEEVHRRIVEVLQERDLIRKQNA